MLFRSDYGFKLNKKEKALARRSALSLKANNGAIKVVEDFTFEQPKTKNFAELTKKLQLSDKKTLLVLPGQNKNVYLSARNLQNVEIITASDINTYKIMNSANLVLTEESVAVIDNLLKA